VRRVLSEHYPISADEDRRLRRTATFALDTNVLLDLHRFTKGTRGELIEILQGLAKEDRVWVPHQAALEYHKALADVVSRRQANYQSLVNQLHSWRKTFDEKLGPLPAEIEGPLSALQRALESVRDSHCSSEEDSALLDRITTLFQGRVGTPYPNDVMAQKHKEADARYKAKTPPGFIDAQKEGTRQYGDFILWSQMIDYAREKKRSVIFVTGERKDDWWQDSHDGTRKPHPELRREFKIQTAQQFHMYDTHDFIAKAGRTLQVSVSKRTLDEARAARERPRLDIDFKRYEDVRERESALGEELAVLEGRYAAVREESAAAMQRGDSEDCAVATRAGDAIQEEITRRREILREVEAEAYRLRSVLAHPTGPTGPSAPHRETYA
jgi:hypothetical protein